MLIELRCIIQNWLLEYWLLSLNVILRHLANGLDLAAGYDKLTGLAVLLGGLTGLIELVGQVLGAELFAVDTRNEVLRRQILARTKKRKPFSRAIIVSVTLFVIDESFDSGCPLYLTLANRVGTDSLCVAFLLLWSLSDPLFVLVNAVYDLGIHLPACLLKLTVPVRA